MSPTCSRPVADAAARRLREERTDATRRRTWLAPEVIQTSALDCGPATLQCVCLGLGLDVDYGRLRELCQTDVDGTSIDTLEEVALRLGLDAQQLVVPADSLLDARAELLPAIVVKRQASGHLHFVVLWRVVGPWVQLMDPHAGRVWMRTERFRRELFVHDQPVRPEMARALLGSEALLGPLGARLAGLGIAEPHARYLAPALADPTHRALAALDAATRMVATLAAASAVRGGRECDALLGSILARVAERGALAIPQRFWAVRDDHDDLDADQVMLLGAVVLRFERRASEIDAALGTRGGVVPQALRRSRNGAVKALFELARRDARVVLASTLPAVALMTAGAIAETVLLRGALDSGGDLVLGRQRLAAAGALVVLGFALLVLQSCRRALVQRFGFLLDVRLRIAFMRKLPRIGDRYFRSRLVSDLAERGHSLHAVRSAPLIAERAVQCSAELLATTAAIAFIDLRSLAPALVASALTFGIALVSRVRATEAELRQRSHAGVLGRFYLDTLVGLAPIRSHGAEATIANEHEGLVVDWARAARSALSVRFAQLTAQTVAGFACMVWLIVAYVQRAGAPQELLLLLFWGARLPALGQELLVAVAQGRATRATADRVLEPLRATEEPPPEEPKPRARVARPGMDVRFVGVSVSHAGTTILDDVTLELPAGAHVAIVGRSGAGKSSLVGSLLGWTMPSRGEIRVDGERLTPATVHAIRQQIAWIDPSVQLWNRDVLDNLRYGQAPSLEDIGQAASAADLGRLLEQLPDGMHTKLGEGGALVSGGEGQRVRLARAFLRDDARLVLLDEPFRGLDRARRRTMLDTARRRWSAATLLCVTHDVEETLRFDHVVVVDGGRVVASGSPAALAATPGSPLHELLRRERHVQEVVWRDPRWRRLRVAGGAIEEEAAAP